MEMRQLAQLAVVAAMLALFMHGCATRGPSACPKTAPCPKCPVCPGAEVLPPSKPLQPARWEDLPGWRDDDPLPALGAFLESCRPLSAKPAWSAVCAQAKTLSAQPAAAIREFFETRFAPYEVVNADGGREGLITGYYEPLLKGSRRRSKAYPYAIRGVPDDLLVVDLSEIYPDLKGYRLRGRLEGRKVVPYFSRAELVQRREPLAGKTLFWAADAVELFFLQVQGSGRIQLEDGSRVRLGYADQNGYPYKSIGRWLVDNAGLRPEEASMEGIKRWVKANPGRLDELLNSNPSYVFFRELANAEGGPIGSLGVPLTAGRSVAVDVRTVPLGAPVYLATTQPASSTPLQRLMVAQDTGGAIRGPVRADFFWGFGPEAGSQAGKMRQQGRLWVLLPPEAAPK